MNNYNNLPSGQFSANSQGIRNFQSGNKRKPLIIAGILVVSILVAGGGYLAYSQRTANQSGLEPTASLEQISPEVIDPAAPATSGTPQVGTSTAPALGQPAPTASTPAAVTPAPQPTGIPQGVATVVDSIEQNGLKNNPYVLSDTSNIPSGAKVKIDRGSWTSGAEDMGSVSGTISVDGRNMKGFLSFQNVQGTWKVLGYSVEM